MTLLIALVMALANPYALAVDHRTPSVGGAAAENASSYRYVTRWPRPTWHLKKPTAVAFDSAGNVYVADRDNNRVQKFTSQGLLLARWGALGSADGAFNQPSGIAVDASGNVYVADTGNHRIQKFSSSGTFLAKWGRSGGPDFSGSGNGEFNGPKGIAVDSSGYVYVADTANARIQKFTSAGAFVTKWGTPGSNVAQFLAPTDVAVDASGTVWVVDADATNARVQRFDSNGTTSTAMWGVYGTGNGQFKAPSGITVDSAGNVYVADKANHRVQKFTGSGVFLAKWGAWGPDDGDFNDPMGIEVDLEGNIRVADTDNDRVCRYSPEGTWLGIAGSYGTSQGRFKSPAGVAVGPSGEVFVADALNHRVQRFDAAGTIILAWGRGFATSANDGFNEPSAIAVTTTGTVFVADTKNNRIKKHLPDGTYVTKWGSLGTGDGWFTAPRGVAVDGLGNVYVADTGNHRVQVFDSDGNFIRKWGAQGSADGQFNSPRGITVSGSGTVLVADTGNNRVQMFSPLGVFLGKFGSAGSGNGQFAAPSDVAVEPDGHVLVADRDNNRVQKFSSGGSFLLKYGTHGTEPGEFMRPASIEAGEDHKSYVCETDNHRVQAFVPYTPVGVTISGVADGVAYPTTVTPSVTFVGDDLVSTAITLNSAPWTPGSIAAEGSYTLWAWANDSTGAEASVTARFWVDKSPPATVDDALASYDDTATITLTSTDTVSWVSATYYRLDGGQTQSGTGLTVTSAGAHMLDYWSVDAAGNVESTHTVGFAVADTLPPITTSNALPAYNSTATITLTAVDPGSGVAATYWRLNGGATQTGTLVTTTTVGSHTLEFWSEDNVGHVEATKSVHFEVFGGADVERLADGNRFLTAVALSQQTFAGGSVSTVVLATGESYADALAASSLAGAHGSPLLLTQRAVLPSAVLAEITRLGATDVVLVGGEAAISSGVATALGGAGKSVRRVAGSNRYATAAEVAREVAIVLGGSTPSTALVVRGDGFADALAVAPIAYRQRFPVLLTPTNTLHASTSDAITDLGISEVLVAGGKSAVSDGVLGAIDALSGVDTVSRVSGSNRYDTAAKVARRALDEGWCSAAFIGVATGANFPDALGGGAVCGARGGVLLLTAPDSLSPETAAFLSDHSSQVLYVRLFGGLSALTSGVHSQIEALLH